MIFEIEISEQAKADLRGIFEYTAFELQSPENAAGQLGQCDRGRGAEDGQSDIMVCGAG